MEVVKRAPLVSIDLIVRDTNERVLLGLRNNEPARGFWFVPGGVIHKNERIAQAFARITAAELGCAQDFGTARLLGVYEHLYDRNFADAPGFGTHYVVLAHTLQHDGSTLRPDDQHQELRWWAPDELLANPTVHPYSKAYFPS